jgi:metal-responsive CopG/Arc/MetJ family transcriptional regulator
LKLPDQWRPTGRLPVDVDATQLADTLSGDLIARIDKLAGSKVSRSSYIEQILRDFVDGCAQARKDARETAAINRHAAQLNAEMSDALSFQAKSADE